jgi:predicted transposase/invertase (TIGR01784 family)
MKAKYIDPFTDYGFKKIFGEEASKPVLQDFLNSLLPPENKIKSLSFKNTEQLGQTTADRKSLFDIYCEAESGEKFIVELQKVKQNFFKDRSVYYSTFPIREQAEKGEWNYNLTPVFFIGILDFTFNDYDSEMEKGEVVHTIKLKNQNGKTFYEKLTYIYLEMPNFMKQEKDLITRLDKWIFFIKNLEDFQNIPTIFRGETIFNQAFDKAELSKMNNVEWESYEASLKEYRDMKGYIETAFEEGEIRGEIRGEILGKQKVAKSLNLDGVPIKTIAKATGLSEEDIEKL